MSTVSKGDLILVTGVNGYIASHVADQLLEAGFSVRGTTRSKDKVGWMFDLFDKKYGEGKFEAVEVPDMYVIVSRHGRRVRVAFAYHQRL